MAHYAIAVQTNQMIERIPKDTLHALQSYIRFMWKAQMETTNELMINILPAKRL
jgi:hypothetical protein